MARINFGGVEEEVVTRGEFPLEKAREVLKDEVVAVLAAVLPAQQGLGWSIKCSNLVRLPRRPANQPLPQRVSI